MCIENELKEYSSSKDMLITIGVFDGVHVGHKYLIAQLKDHAKNQNLLSGVVTFKQHPYKVLKPQNELTMLCSLSQKIKLIEKEGVDVVIPVSFTPELAQLSAREFVCLLHKYLRMRGLVIGYDFTLGRNKEGNANMLRQLGDELGFTVIEAYCRRINGEVISSTTIRNLINKGHNQIAYNMLGWGDKFDSAQSPI